MEKDDFLLVEKRDLNHIDLPWEIPVAGRNASPTAMHTSPVLERGDLHTTSRRLRFLLCTLCVIFFGVCFAVNDHTRSGPTLSEFSTDARPIVLEIEGVPEATMRCNHVMTQEERCKLFFQQTILPQIHIIEQKWKRFLSLLETLLLHPVQQTIQHVDQNIKKLAHEMKKKLMRE